MRIKNSELKLPILLNLILICLIYGDYFLPSRVQSIEKFASFSSNVTRGASWKGSSGISIDYTLECQNENFYRIARIPAYANSFRTDDKVYIQKTFILSKLKYINNNGSNRKISILSFPEIIIGFAFCLVITLANIFTDKLPDFILGFVSIFIYFVSIGYLFWLS